MKIFSIGILVFLTACAFSQNMVQKEQVLSSSDKDLGLISVTGIKSAVRGGYNNFFFTSSLEIKDIKNSGFIIREDYKFTKYNDLLAKEWETKIDKKYGFVFDGPRGETLGDKEGVFFYEYPSVPIRCLKEFNVTFFDSKGNPTTKEYKLEETHDGVACSFLNAKGLNVLVYDVEDISITYELLTFSRESLQMTKETLPLKTDPIEAKAYVKGNSSGLYVGWRLLSNEDNKTILVKSYIVPDSKKFFVNKNPDKKLLLETIELSPNNKLSNAKEFHLESLKVEGECVQPQLFFDTGRDEIYVIETYIGEKTRYNFGGLYFLKFKYGTTKNVQSTIIAIDKTLGVLRSGASIPRIYDDPHFNRVIYTFPCKIAYYPFSGTFDFWSPSYYKMKNYGYVWARLDNTGKQLASANVVYTNGLGTLDQLFYIPKEITEYVGAKPIKASPIDFIFDLPKRIDIKNVVQHIIEKPDHYTIVTISEEKSEYKAYNITK